MMDHKPRGGRMVLVGLAFGFAVNEATSLLDRGDSLLIVPITDGSIVVGRTQLHHLMEI